MAARRLGRLDALFVGGYAVLLVAGAVVIAEIPRDLPDRIEIRMRFSRYEPSVVNVPAGTPVTFVLRNEDPIDHEWLIGDEQMHARHRSGTEPEHSRRPTEVSVPALSVIETTITFVEPVSWRYICHLPGHEAYGMVGMLTSR